MTLDASINLVPELLRPMSSFDRSVVFSRFKKNASIADCRLTVIIEKINISAIAVRNAMREDGNEDAISVDHVLFSC